jgi:hypothetical protein
MSSANASRATVPTQLSRSAAVSPGVADADRPVQSEPAHQLGVDVVGGCGPPLPDPGVGFGPGGGDLIGQAGDDPPGLAIQGVAGVGEQPGGVDDRAVAVELMLASGGVADSDGSAVGEAGPSRELGLPWTGPSVDREQHRQAGPRQATGVEEPGEEGPRLLRLADAEERGDADRRVAGPRVAVVPVAVTAEALRKRRGRRGDRRAGGRIGEQPQGDEAAHHGVAMVGDLDSGCPGAPAGLVAGELRGGDVRWDDDQRAVVGDGDDDRHQSVGMDLEVDGPVDLDRGTVGGDGDGEVPALTHERTGSPSDVRRHHPFVAESRNELKAGAHTSSPGREPANEHRGRQEPPVDLGDETVGQLELATLHRPRDDQCGGVGPVGAGSDRGGLGNSDAEPAGFRAADEPTE